MGTIRQGGQAVKLINCECGYVIRGDTDEELVAVALAHLRSAHPQLADRVTTDQLLAMAEIVD